MSKAFGIINFAGNDVQVNGMLDYRPIGAFSFLGRYRVIDFPISNMSNSGIDVMQVYVRRKPRSLVEHLGTGRHYNINSKRGKLNILFAETIEENNVYNTDIAAYIENFDCFDEIDSEYVVLAPSYMIYTADYSTFLQSHIESGADITLMYHSVDNAKDHFLNCHALDINKQKGVLSIEPNHGNTKSKNIFMDTYVMKKALFLELVQKAHKLSSMYTLADIVREECEELDVRAYSHRGFFATITDFNSYYEANMDNAEAMIKYVIRYVLDNCPDEMAFFNQFIDKGLIERLELVANSEFGRITYTDAIEVLKKNNKKFQFPVEWGVDIQTEHERYLTEVVFKKPVFVTDYPKEIKSFYMKQNPDGKTVAAADMLVPGIGELIGGSQREEDYDKLVARMDELGLDKSSYDWYLNLRKFGGVEHAGYGLGFERMIMYLTGIQNIRDVLPFPRTAYGF